ncbi:putative ABC transporter peptide-binding protein YtcQ [Paenibacillus baekrokdamisoli]|uniref:Putative ABC transporter peptide-binding protein YtcQ n=1 Tax=Paenibacillus baekrokdamisoli TaxID=1712516 RepID=A0A3G9J0C5_9BACL|nr:extracellular solute-binding protein [Paenibacillus baekrokdamisoli]MBB3071343.1 putative aldouronate transport system substrate-binding protein [Paenibacillus baekrokdamisoli]BBH24620.1 putative ABC transporter peptide-binding protein YtcQ [Paenibacillus baekrokdamisoli]
MKRTLALTFSFILMVTVVLSACSKKEETGNTKQTPAPSQSGEQTPPTTDDGMKDGKYDPVITVTTVTEKKPTVKYTNGDSLENNPWTRAYEKEFGIKLKYLWEVDLAQYKQKMNLTIASGDLPDFFKVDQEQFKQLRDADLIEDMTDVYNKSASDRVKAVMADAGDLVMKSATFDGKLMGIPYTYPTREAADMIWIRSDWLKKLNLPEPKTMQDVLAIAEAFTTKDPDGNNKNDTFGLALDKDFSAFNGFLNSFHAYKGIWLKDANGQLVYSTIQPQMKQALGVLQEMFKKGQIDPEFGSKAFDKVGEDIASGKIGMLYNPFWAPMYPLQTSADKNKNAEWKFYPLASIDAEPAKFQAELGVNPSFGYWVVKKGSKHPEAMLKMLDYYLSINESIDPKVISEMSIGADGSEIWPMNAILASKSFGNSDQWLRIADGLKTGDTSKLSAGDKSVLEKVQGALKGDRTLWGWDKVYGENGSLGQANEYRKNDQFQINAFYGAAVSASVDKGPTLSKLELEMITKIIMGKASINDFDKFVSDWKKFGGDEVTQQINEWAANNK